MSFEIFLYALLNEAFRHGVVAYFLKILVKLQQEKTVYLLKYLACFHYIECATARREESFVVC